MKGVTMNINEMTMELLIKENKALKKANHSMAIEINTGFDTGKSVDIVWITRDEMKGYSDIVQAGGINSIKADAIEAACVKLFRDGSVAKESGLLYANKLRGNNG